MSKLECALLEFPISKDQRLTVCITGPPLTEEQWDKVTHVMELLKDSVVPLPLEELVGGGA